VARARALTGGVHGAGELDRELDALLEGSAVPVEITVEAASRELAERLGGAPVERRSGPTRAPAAPAPPPAAEAPDEPEAGRSRPVRPRTPDMESSSAGEPHAARLSRTDS
jgi:hypothetical protein